MRTEGVSCHSIVSYVEVQVRVEQQRDRVLLCHGAVHGNSNGLDGKVTARQVGAHLVVRRVRNLHALKFGFLGGCVAG